jgi:hypothetical protein
MSRNGESDTEGHEKGARPKKKGAKKAAVNGKAAKKAPVKKAAKKAGGKKSTTKKTKWRPGSRLTERERALFHENDEA